jgi:hypothetical protein
MRCPPFRGGPSTPCTSRHSQASLGSVFRAFGRSFIAANSAPAQIPDVPAKAPGVRRSVASTASALAIPRSESPSAFIRAKPVAPAPHLRDMMFSLLERIFNYGFRAGARSREIARQPYRQRGGAPQGRSRRAPAPNIVMVRGFRFGSTMADRRGWSAPLSLAWRGVNVTLLLLHRRRSDDCRCQRRLCPLLAAVRAPGLGVLVGNGDAASHHGCGSVGR